MKQVFRFGLLQQLLTGFAAGCLFVAILIGIGARMLEQMSSHLVVTIEQHVRPLARIHNLEAQLAGLRTHELELAHQNDIFVMQSHTAQMHAELDRADSAVIAFAAGLEAADRQQADLLRQHWNIYRQRLLIQLNLAERMETVTIERNVSSGSHLPYLAMRRQLSDLAEATQAEAEAAYERTIADQQSQQFTFLALICLSSAILVIGLALSGRTVVRRVRALHRHAQELAAGRDGGRIEISRHDEIGDLALAFTAMREQVLSRESALTEARRDLEGRVEERTRDLTRANRRLLLFSQLFEQSPAGILVATLDGVIEYANPAHQRITGLPSAALRGSELADALAGGESLDMPARIADAIDRGMEWDCERECRLDGAPPRWERLRLVVVASEDGAPAHLVLTREDITERHAQQARIAYQAQYDALTGLPNRLLARDRLEQAIQHGRRNGDQTAVLYIDLDNFKEINDTLGHAAGDILLVQAAERLRATVRDEDTVARLGGDEFLVVLGDIRTRDDIAPIAEKLIEAFQPPFTIDERALMTTPSIGIAVCPDDGDDPTVLMRNADLAMYEAKEAGRNTWRHFNQAIHDLSLRRLEIGRHLRDALNRNELRVFFHPLVSASSGRIIGSEALVRWTSPELGPVGPDVFIPVAEQNGLIVELGHWVMRTACAQLAEWSRTHPGFIMAINVSPRQFRAQGFVDSVRACIAEFGVAPEQLEIEITEGLLLHSHDEVRFLIEELREVGVRLSMDDFGTGYSSLSYLREFPFHTIKIDRSFVRDLTSDRSDRALVVAVVRMAQALGLQIIAEGVESDDQWMFLAAMDCDILQGFRFGKPIPADEFTAHWVNAELTPPRIEGLPVWTHA